MNRFSAVNNVAMLAGDNLRNIIRALPYGQRLDQSIYWGTSQAVVASNVTTKLIAWRLSGHLVAALWGTPNGHEALTAAAKLLREEYQQSGHTEDAARMQQLLQKTESCPTESPSEEAESSPE